MLYLVVQFEQWELNIKDVRLSQTSSRAGDLLDSPRLPKSMLEVS